MFKVLFLQRYYALGDKQIQYQIIDRTSFRQFLGIHTVQGRQEDQTHREIRNHRCQYLLLQCHRSARKSNDDFRLLIFLAELSWIAALAFAEQTIEVAQCVEAAGIAYL